MITYKKQKESRLSKRFLWMECDNYKYYWNIDLKEWVHKPKHGEDNLTFSLRCDSIKAFKRRLKNTPKGVEFRLVSRFIGFDITGMNK